MPQPIPDDVFEKAPKVLWESSRMGMNKDFLLVAIKSGANIGMQLLTPAHAKQIAQMFQWQVEQYEKEHGVIDAKWDPNTVSPIQTKTQ